MAPSSPVLDVNNAVTGGELCFFTPCCRCLKLHLSASCLCHSKQISIHALPHSMQTTPDLFRHTSSWIAYSNALAENTSLKWIAVLKAILLYIIDFLPSIRFCSESSASCHVVDMPDLCRLCLCDVLRDTLHESKKLTWHETLGIPSKRTSPTLRQSN